MNIAARLQAIAAPGSICVSEAVYQQVYKKIDLGFEDLGVRELKNIEHPIRLYRVTGSAADQPATPAPPDAPRRPAEVATWTDAVLHPSSIFPLVAGAYLIATAFGLPPAGHLLPAWGIVLVGVAAGRMLRLRTGRHGFFLMAVGAGLVLAAVIGDWRRGAPWWLVAGGIAVVAAGLARLRTGGLRPPRRSRRRDR